MTDDNQSFNLYDKVRHDVPDTRRWWEKQRFIIPIVVAVLAGPIWYVAGLMAADIEPQQQQTQAGEVASQPAEVEQQPRSSEGAAVADAATESSAGADAGRDQTGADGSAAGSDSTKVLPAHGEQAPAGRQRERAAVCERVLALRDDLKLQGANPVEVYQDMLAIQEQAAGTAVSDEADAAVAALEGFVSGTHDSDAVVSAGAALVDAC